MYNNLLRLAQEYQWYRNTNGTGVPMVILILYFNPLGTLMSGARVWWWWMSKNTLPFSPIKNYF